MRELLFLLLVFACPLLMVLMMRGGHGHGGHGHAHAAGHGDMPTTRQMSIADLHRLRDDLDALIAERDDSEPAEPTPPPRPAAKR